MINRKKIISGIVALSMAMMLSAMAVFAQDGQGRGGYDGRGKHGKGHDGFGRFAKNLNLTDAQKQQMQQIAERHNESTRALREQMRGLRKNSDDMTTDGSFNEAAVRQAAQARANIEVEMAVARARMKSEMYAVLTAEQKAQLAQQREQRKQQKQQRINQRRGENSTVQQ